MSSPPPNSLEARVRNLRKASKESYDKTQQFVTQLDNDFTSESPFFVEVGRLQHQIADCHQDIKSIPDTREAAELTDQLHQTTKLLETCLALKPRTGSWFIGLFFGQVNCVVYSNEQRCRLKDEYVRFRKRMTFVFVVFPLLCLGLPRSMWVMDTIYHLWLLYYYVAHALRENFLKVNGSQIRSWWIWHHYLSIGLTTILLTFPMGSEYESIRRWFLQYAAIQGFVQVLSNRYQEKRLYKTRALGKSSEMDVPDTDTVTMRSTSSDGGWGGLLTVVPFLFCVQGMQLIGAVTLLSMAWAGARAWQMSGLGVFFFFIAVGNLITTVRTLMERAKSKKRSA